MSVHNHVHNNAVSAAIPNLDPAGLLLSGRHLIEASAGTGKTFNITRLYLRLLLERRLPVQQILVMTFTKAATEELRGRIDRELRHAAAHWGRLGQSDPFFAALEARVDPQLAPLLLHNALLHLDEAAIFTIHGFCARVLRQHALASDLAMELEMEADTSEQALEAVRDWLRGIAHQPAYQLLSERGWHTPEAFMALFGRAIRSQAELLAAEPQQFIDTALTAKQTVRQQLLALEGEIDTRLISSHKEVVKRGQEWETLLNWLGNDEIGVPPKLAMDFVNGNRYRKDEELKQWLQPFKDLKEQLPALAQAAKQAAAYPLVRDGIAAIRARFAAAKTQQGLMDFDDLISLLAERVSAVEGAALVSALRNQYPVALVDEFQDTDPHQYAILERVYPPRAQAVEGDGKEPSALFMIGDPKQAIYS
ncbi:MAG TPA: UvrD-helicase domain-containing protein, partial [Motiliproteus sp.]